MGDHENETVTVEMVLAKFNDIMKVIDTADSQSRIIKSVDGLTQVADLAKDIGENPNEYLNFHDSSEIMNHGIFLYIRDTMIIVMEELNETSCSKSAPHENRFFNETSYMIREMIDYMTNIETFTELFIQKSFIEPIGQFLNTIASSGKHRYDYDFVFGIARLLEAFEKFRKRTENHDHSLLLLLLDAAINCLCSNYYLEAFKGIKTDATLFYREEDLFLAACPKYVYEYHGQYQKDKTAIFSETLLISSQQLIEHFQISTLSRCQTTLLEAFIHLLHSLSIIDINDGIELTSLINAFIVIAKETEFLLSDTNTRLKEHKTNIVCLVLTLIHRLAEFPKFRLHIKEIDGTIKLFETLSFIETTKEERVQFLANIILCLLISDGDTDQVNNIEQTTKTFIDNLNVAKQHPSLSHNGIDLGSLLLVLQG